MKGKIFVVVFSLCVLGVFGVFCYLMTNIDPPKFSQNDTRRYLPANQMDLEDSRLLRDNPDYGLEKIPEGVDADEYRKNYMAKVKKFDFETVRSNLDEPIKRVVPPIWPSDDVIERNVEEPKDKELKSREVETFSPIKGHRRSVNDDNLHGVKKGPGSILLKIVDDDGHKKIEIKFVSEENIETTKLRKNRSSNHLKSNVTFMENQRYNHTTLHKHDNKDENVIELKANDVILLQVVDDSDINVDKNVLSGANITVDVQEIVMNITDFNSLNKSLNNETKLVDLEAAEWKVKDVMHNNLYNFSLVFNSDNKTIV